MIVIASAVCFHFQRRFTVLGNHLPVEAGPASGVASGTVASDANLQPQGVLIAIGAQFDDALQIAGRFTLLPKCVARA